MSKKEKEEKLVEEEETKTAEDVKVEEKKEPSLEDQLADIKKQLAYTAAEYANYRARSAKEKEEGFVCPNCGAPIKGTSFGVCEYCGSTVTTGMYDWVLSDFGVVKNDTVDEGIMTNSQ